MNARPLVYIGDDVNSRINLTPSHFLTLNPNIGIPEIEYDIDDPSYLPLDSSTDKLLKIWKKGQKTSRCLLENLERGISSKSQGKNSDEIQVWTSAITVCSKHWRCRDYQRQYSKRNVEIRQTSTVDY